MVMPFDCSALRRRGFLSRADRALPDRRLPPRVAKHRAHIGRKPRLRHGRRRQTEHAGDVARARHEARDFVEVLLQRRAGIMLVAVDHAGLQGRVYLAERHRRRARAHQLNGLGVDRRLDRTDLEAGELAGLRDVARSRDDLAKPERVAPCERPDANGVGRVVRDLVAERSVHDPVHVVPIPPEEGKIQHLQPRRDAAPDRRARNHEVHEPFLQLLDDLALLAERAAWEDADRDLAAGGAIHRLPEFVGEDVQ